jgi:cytoskeletal protein CcmA (bactofilin family)
MVAIITSHKGGLWPPHQNDGPSQVPFQALATLERICLPIMWKPTNTPSSAPTPSPEPQRSYTPAVPETPSVPRPASPPINTQEQATLGKSLVIKGEVTGSESLYIDGRVEGSINLPGNRVTVGRNGVVAANISAREIVVLGKVRGNMTASDRVDIRGEGSLTGDVVAQRISIEDGAYFKGGIDIRKPGQKANGEAKESSTTTPGETAAAAAAARV